MFHAIAKAGVLAERSCTPALAGDHTGYMRAVGSTVVHFGRRRRRFFRPTFFRSSYLENGSIDLDEFFLQLLVEGGHTVSEKV